jgi:hypothetical protein
MISHATRPSGTGGFRLPGLDRLAGDPLARQLGRRLDDGHHYLRGPTPGGIDPIDSVVVGRGGVFAVSLGADRGRFHRRNGHWYRWNRSTSSWAPWDAAHIVAARLAAHRLGLFLERAGSSTEVVACLLVDAGTDVTWDDDQRPGLEIHATADALAARIERDEVLTPAQVDRIVALLDPRQPLPRFAPSVHGG